MSRVIDSVASAHRSDLCGVVRFNRILAKYLSVPHVLVSQRMGDYPLISVKASEVRGLDPPSPPYALFVHQFGPILQRWVEQADTVFVANPELATQVPGPVRVAWCPDTLGKGPFPALKHPESVLTVFTLGMAHKTVWDQHSRLRDWLVLQSRPFMVYVSSAFHEGHDLEADLASLVKGVADVYGDRGLYLGFLSNEMTRAMMVSCSLVAAFYPRGIRQNSTSALAALRMGCPVVTNFDEWSPDGMVPGMHAFEVGDMPHYDPSLWRAVGHNAQLLMSQWYTWEGLRTVLEMDPHG